MTIGFVYRESYFSNFDWWIPCYCVRILCFFAKIPCSDE
jgi:hypothetical protein